ncbi:hypothetical protein BDV97DRAFT_56102 [Delphinella strobiligena]|nr:hypothetical protein BDV97DRAFT_56102 [Delphinella strobiligena]
MSVDPADPSSASLRRSVAQLQHRQDSINVCRPSCGGEQRFPNKFRSFERLYACQPIIQSSDGKPGNCCSELADWDGRKIARPTFQSYNNTLDGDRYHIDPDRACLKARPYHLHTDEQALALAGHPDITAVPFDELTLERKTGPPAITQGTAPRKRAATSDIQSPSGLPRLQVTCGAAAATQTDWKCAKRLACGAQTPFSPEPDGLKIESGHRHKRSSNPQCASHATFEGQSMAPLMQGKRTSNHLVSVHRGAADQRQIVSRTNSNSDSKKAGISRYPGILLQPDSRPITSDQLAVEVKNIYSDLVAVEAKCISLDNSELASDRKQIESHEQQKWQAMMALHRTLLYEHHDFLSASQHPAAHEPLRKLILKYSIPARMWKHAIHSFLEVLRRRLPDSMDYMLQFIYTAYQMIALLYETVAPFKATWIECLGDLARYRMAIEDSVQRDRETWGVVARSWYSLASDMDPQIGRLYHHLGILARPNAVQQLHFYCRSLTCIEPFPNAQESLSALLISTLESRSTGKDFLCVSEIDSTFLYLHAVMFMGFVNEDRQMKVQENFFEIQASYSSKLEEQLDSLGARWKMHGVYVAIANIGACFGYGCQKSGNRLALAMENSAKGCVEARSAIGEENDCEQISRPAYLLFSVFTAVLHRKADFRVLPHVHVLLVFLRRLVLLACKSASFIDHLLELVPWTELVAFLNSFAKHQQLHTRVASGNPPISFQHGARDASPLPEDYSLRGEVWAHGYFTEHWFKDPPDEESRYLEQASTDENRVQRVIWLGVCVAKLVGSIDFDVKRMCFMTAPGLSFPSVSPPTKGPPLIQHA